MEPEIHELPTPDQGKYEEEKREKDSENCDHWERFI